MTRITALPPIPCHSERNLPCVGRKADAVEESLCLASKMRSGKSYFVYILGSLSGTLYIGVTSRPERRIFEHKQHLQEGFTSKYDVDRLLYYESYDEIGKAIDREKQLKRWRREKKIALIRALNPQWIDLSREWCQTLTRG